MLVIHDLDFHIVYRHSSLGKKWGEQKETQDVSAVATSMGSGDRQTQLLAQPLYLHITKISLQFPHL